MIPLGLYSIQLTLSYKAKMCLQWFLMLNVPQIHVLPKVCWVICQWHDWEMVKVLGDGAEVKLRQSVGACLWTIWGLNSFCFFFFLKGGQPWDFSLMFLILFCPSDKTCYYVSWNVIFSQWWKLRRSYCFVPLPFSVSSSPPPSYEDLGKNTELSLS